MEFLCPNCQKTLTVLDQYAGQQMKCPLCDHTFQAPALAPVLPPISVTPPPDPGIYSVLPEPAPSPPPELFSAPSASPDQEIHPRKEKISKSESVPLPPPPPGDYTQVYTIWINPRVTPWIFPVGMVLLFVLLFLPWVVYTPSVEETVRWNAWDLAMGMKNSLLIFYILIFLLAWFAMLAVTGIQLAGMTPQLPPAAQQIWPWLPSLLGGIDFLAFFFLVLQLLTGFTLQDNNRRAADIFAHYTFWLWLTFFLQLLVLCGTALTTWLDMRGDQRPVPRIDFRW